MEYYILTRPLFVSEEKSNNYNKKNSQMESEESDDSTAVNEPSVWRPSENDDDNQVAISCQELKHEEKIKRLSKTIDDLKRQLVHQRNFYLKKEQRLKSLYEEELEVMEEQVQQDFVDEIRKYRAQIDNLRADSEATRSNKVQGTALPVTKVKETQTDTTKKVSKQVSTNKLKSKGSNSKKLVDKSTSPYSGIIESLEGNLMNREVDLMHRQTQMLHYRLNKVLESFNHCSTEIDGLKPDRKSRITHSQSVNQPELQPENKNVADKQESMGSWEVVVRKRRSNEMRRAKSSVNEASAIAKEINDVRHWRRGPRPKIKPDPQRHYHEKQPRDHNEPIVAKHVEKNPNSYAARLEFGVPKKSQSAGQTINSEISTLATK